MLWGGGAPFRVGPDDGLVDRRGQSVRMLGAVPEVLRELKTDPKWEGTVVAVASCTDEPAWAQECMAMFDIGGGLCIKDAMQVSSRVWATGASHGHCTLCALANRTSFIWGVG